MKRMKGNWMEVPNNAFWMSPDGKGNNTAFPMKYYQLSVSAKWLYMTLKFLEHKYTGENNNYVAYVKQGDCPDEAMFYQSNKELAKQANMSVRTMQRARKELEDAGLIVTCSVHVKGNPYSNPTTGYFIVDGDITQ